MNTFIALLFSFIGGLFIGFLVILFYKERKFQKNEKRKQKEKK